MEFHSNFITYDFSKHSDSFFNINFLQRYTNQKDARRQEFYADNKHNYILIYVTRGQLEIKSDTHEHIINETNILIYKPYGFQILTSPPESSYVFTVFSGTSVSEILSELQLRCDIVYSLTKKNKTLEYTTMNYNKQFEYIRQELKLERKNCNITAAAMLIEFLGLYSGNISEINMPSYPEIIQDILKEIKQYYNTEIDIDKIIKKSHLSKSRFYYLFKKHTGFSIHQYQNNYRLTVAADFLTVYDFSVSETSKRIGYNDPLYFSRLFKRKYNMSPSKYKKMYKKHNSISMSKKFYDSDE